MPDTAADLLARIRNHVRHPASVRELIQRLRVPRAERVAFRRQLKRLAAEGTLVEVRGHRYGLPDQMDSVVGRLETSRGGFGFVRPDRRAAAPDGVFVGMAEPHLAMHGDRVVARVERVRGGRAEGRVVRILERRSATLVGRFAVDTGGVGRVSSMDQRLPVEIAVAAGDAGGARPDDMVVVEISRWPTATRGPVGRVVEVLGRLDQPGVDTMVVIRKHALPDAHGPAALAEARAIAGGPDSRQSSSVGASAIAGRTDFRRHAVVTIDGERARDFDDAVSLERLPNGRFRLGVHIADVGHYVREGSALDAEAYERGTSVYFPERALHLFPELLATGLCSLKAGVDRLVQSCVMEVDRDGEVVRHEFHDGVIRCRARMTYTEVNAILTDRDPDTLARHADLVPLFESMRELALALSARRRRMGSIDFDLEEPEIVLDEAGMIEAIVAAERNVAHRIVEEFMLLANRTVARFLEPRLTTSIYRVHEPPDPVKLLRFEQILSRLGHSLGAPAGAVAPGHFRALLERLQGRPEQRPVAYLMLRALQRARYDQVNLGHFGLAFDCYTHFTSPIRRYPDLLVHRLLRAARRRDAGLSDDSWPTILEDVARHASERERRAEEAERELVAWKKTRFMKDRVGDEFDGFVTGVAPFGLFVQLVDPFVEGLVHVSTMVDDHYRYCADAHELRGSGSRRAHRLGDRVRVRVLNVDCDRRQIGLGLVGVPEPSRHGAPGTAAGRARRRPPARKPARRRSG